MAKKKKMLCYPQPPTVKSHKNGSAFFSQNSPFLAQNPSLIKENHYKFFSTVFLSVYMSKQTMTPGLGKSERQI